MSSNTVNSDRPGPWLEACVLHPQRRSLVSETLTLTRARRFLREKNRRAQDGNNKRKQWTRQECSTVLYPLHLVRYQIYTSSQQNTLRTVLSTVL